MAQIDELSGPRGRSAFVRSAIERAFVIKKFRWTDIEAERAGALENQDHEWTAIDPAAWVQERRRAMSVADCTSYSASLIPTVLIDFLGDDQRLDA